MKQIHAEIPESSLQTKIEYRDRIDMLRGRLHLLAGKDRLLMTMYLENNITFSQIGQLTGVDPANIGRRIHKVTERLIGGEYIECLKMRESFTAGELAVAREHFLLGESIRKIASDRGMSYYQVQQMIGRIQKKLLHHEGTKKHEGILL